MLTCTKCLLEKAADSFYKQPRNAGGRDRTCKECRKHMVRLNRCKRIEYYRAYDRERGCRQGKEYLARYRSDNPDKYKAQTAVGNAVRDGRLAKASCCQSCGSGGHLHGHHDDYSKPLDVVWLCPACHKQRHKELGWGYIWNLGMDSAA